jgi:ADP-heptose:LPS heptosyltransferase
MHTLERQAEQLGEAGIWPDPPTRPGAAPAPEITWMLRLKSIIPPEALNGDRPMALLVPGAAPRRPAKRWPAVAYAELARRLDLKGFSVRLVGGPSEIEIGHAIEFAAPRVTNLIGRTDLAGIAALGAGAALAVGNDTGPIHLIAAAGAPTVALFSADSDPALCAPRGRVTVLREADLADLAVVAVYEAAMARLEPTTG